MYAKASSDHVTLAVKCRVTPSLHIVFCRYIFVSYIFVSICEMAGKRKGKEKGKQPAKRTLTSKGNKTTKSSDDVAGPSVQDVSVSSHSPTLVQTQNAPDVSSASAGFPPPSSHPESASKTDVPFVSSDSLSAKGSGNLPPDVSSVSSPKLSGPPIVSHPASEADGISLNRSFYSEKDQSIAEQTKGERKNLNWPIRWIYSRDRVYTILF